MKHSLSNFLELQALVGLPPNESGQQMGRGQEANTMFCSCSAPKLPDEMVKTTEEIYVRFHGTAKWYRHDYTRQELEVWSNRIHKSGASCVWAYFNNDYDTHTVRNATELLKQLNAG